MNITEVHSTTSDIKSVTNINQLAQSLLSAERRLEWFPPFRRLGVKVMTSRGNWRQLHILLPLTRHNRNPGGSMFGGAIAALADPIPALACNRIFPGHAVWTRELHIDFRYPGVADLELRFSLDPETERQIGKELEDKGRSTPDFEFGFYLPNGTISAWVTNRVAIRPMGESVHNSGALGAHMKRVER